MEVGDAADGLHHHSKRSRVAGVKGDSGEDEARRGAVVPWTQQHPSSRIYRVSRASGGKDRHSKVYTAKGIRDRRVRLSVSTAIQFYDLQDRLGYDQPSKAIEWLIKAAAAAIDKLPSLDATVFPSTPAAAAGTKNQEVVDGDGDGDGLSEKQLQQQQLTKSGCSSTSETSKGSVLSLSRSETRVKARERARERSATARDKDKEAADDAATATATAAGASTAHRRAVASTSAQPASFTELLTGMAAASASAPTVATIAEHKQSWQPMPVSTSADYFGFPQPRKAGHPMPHTFASPAHHFGNVTPIGMAATQPFNFTGGGGGGGGEPHPEMTQFSILQDHFMPVHAAAASGPAGEYNLNFSMSSGLVGVNRGTLQSNSQSHLSSHHHQLQRLSAPLDAPNIPFLFSPAAAPAAAESQFAAAAALPRWDGFRHSDMKEKGKN